MQQLGQPQRARAGLGRAAVSLALSVYALNGTFSRPRLPLQLSTSVAVRMVPGLEGSDAMRLKLRPV